MNKRKLLSGLVKHQGIEIILNFLFLSFALYFIFGGHESQSDLSAIFDFSVFSSFIAVTLINIIANAIKNSIAAKLEDTEKLTADYHKLIKAYTVPKAEPDALGEAQGEINKLVTWKNTPDSDQTLVLPEIYVCNLYHRPLEIRDSEEKYQLPDAIREHFDELMEAYKASVVYNQLNVRVDGWHWDQERRCFVICTSRTEYFNSLVTNRAMDYKWQNGLTVRSAVDYGPFMRSLEESQLSNHLGFNGFVESSDNMIMFVKRGAHLSIGKNTYGPSVGASLKCKYGIVNGQFTEDGLKNAICSEILDECKMKISPNEVALDRLLIGAYRDMVEGGKPQLLFFLHADGLSKDRIEQDFKASVKTVKKKRYSVVEDGFHFLWLTRDAFLNVELGVDYMLYNGKKYPMTPSTVASVVLTQNHLKHLKEKDPAF